MHTIDHPLMGKERLEKLLYSLSTDTLLVLSQKSTGKSDKEVIEWSMDWRFTTATIESAFREASVAFGIDESTDDARRAAVLKVFARCREEGLMGSASTTSEAKKPTVTAPAPPASTRMTLRGSRGGHQREVALHDGVDLNASPAFKRVFNTNVRRFAQATNTTLTSLASVIGKTPSYFVALSRGAASVNVDKITRFAEKLGISFETLATHEELSEEDVAHAIKARSAGSRASRRHHTTASHADMRG